jgi:hypothetical protein
MANATLIDLLPITGMRSGKLRLDVGDPDWRPRSTVGFAWPSAHRSDRRASRCRVRIASRALPCAARHDRQHAVNVDELDMGAGSHRLRGDHQVRPTWRLAATHYV